MIETNKPDNNPGISEAATGAVKVCRRAGVEKVMAAIHHGCLHFLLSCGPENGGGIVFRDDSYSYEQLKELADEVNGVLSKHPNDPH